jgi:hypothetical protein
MPEPITTGIDVLRRTVAARNSKPHALTAIAGAIEGIGVGSLEAFATGHKDLSIETLKELTKVLYPHAEYDVESGMLRSSNRTPARSFIVPDRYDPTSHPFYVPFDPDAPRIGPQPVKPEPVKAKGPRPGWLAG